MVEDADKREFAKGWRVHKELIWGWIEIDVYRRVISGIELEAPPANSLVLEQNGNEFLSLNALQPKVLWLKRDVVVAVPR